MLLAVNLGGRIGAKARNLESDRAESKPKLLSLLAL